MKLTVEKDHVLEFQERKEYIFLGGTSLTNNSL